jgi:hypothetical protein
MQNHFDVIYDRDIVDDESKCEVVKIRRAKRLHYEDLKMLLCDLMVEFLKTGRTRSRFCDMSNSRIQKTLERIVNFLPIVGGGELDLDRIDDIQLIEIFITEELVEKDGRAQLYVDTEELADGEEPQQYYKPGKIAKLHAFPFLPWDKADRGIYGTAMRRYFEWREAEAELKAEENGKTEEKLELAELETVTP